MALNGNYILDVETQMCESPAVAAKSAAGAPEIAEEECIQLATLMLRALRRANPRALIMGGNGVVDNVLIDGNFDLVRVARLLLRSNKRTVNSGSDGG